MTLLSVVTDVFLQLKETKGTDLFWVESEVIAALNDTYYEIAETTRCFKASSILLVVVGTRTYDLPSDYIFGSLERVEFNNKRIYPISIAELDEIDPDWRSTTGDPERYILDLGTSNQIVVYPSPITAGAGSASVYGVSVFTSSTTSTDPTNNLRVFYAKFPTQLSDDTDVFLHPINNNPRKILTKGAMAILLMKEGEGKDIEKAAIWYKLFVAATKNIRREKGEVVHIMRSISDRRPTSRANLGGHYPRYYFR